MALTDDELRGLVREAIARVHARPAPGPATAARPHVSQTLFVLPRGDDTGACLIEPTVRCNHCGYCQAYGH
jgi:hypothetical protein